MFFHATATQRWQRNLICSLQDNEGHMLVIKEQIGPFVVQYFSNLFQPNELTSNAIEDAFKGLKDRVTSQMNKFLLRDYSADEVCEALKRGFEYSSVSANKSL